MSKHDEKKSRDDAKVEAVKEENSKAHVAHRDVQAAAHQAPAEPDDEVKMSPVNPRKPLDKEPVYAPGVGPSLAAGDTGSSPPSDPRIPPENVSPPGVGPGGASPSAPSAEPAVKAEPVHIPTPAQAGLSQPDLRPGLDPLPEEDPTPSTVPIPPPGPRRVA